MNNKHYSLNTLRKKAHGINYRISKGFVHYHNAVYYNMWDKRQTGYVVVNLRNGFYVPGCYDENFDHLWDLDDVTEFLREEYKVHGLRW